MNFDNDFVTRLARQMLQLGSKDIAPGTPSDPYYTGPGGLFGVTGLERELISTSVQPKGLADVLPVRASQVMYPLYPYLTGFLDGDDTQPDGPCDDPPIAGNGKSCIQTATYGKYSHATRTLEIGRPGQMINRGDFQDMQLINPPMLQNPLEGGSGTGITTPNVDGNPALNQEVRLRMMELGVAFQRQMAKQIYIGNPSNNTNGGYAEFPGLDILIGTNKFDAITGDPCPSLDSQIVDFGSNATSFNGGSNLVNYLTYMMRYFEELSRTTNIGDTKFALVMRSALFYEITAVWPCAYLTYRCVTSGLDASTVLQINGADQVAMRQALRDGKYLLIDDVKYPVIFDDAIPASSESDGCFTSDIYILPLTIRNGTLASVFWEHLDFTNALAVAAEMRVGSHFFSDGGRFLWFAPPPNNRCVQLRAWLEPRLILRTPHLAGRLNNVLYCPLINPREPFPDDNYFVNGGISTPRDIPNLFSDWNQPD